MSRNVGSPKPCKRILFVPGFVADTYCEIERSYVELCATPSVGLEFLWLVTEIHPTYSNFTNPESRHALSEPVIVRYLRENRIPYIVASISKYNAIANLLLFWRLFRVHQIDAVYTHFGYERFWATLFGKLFGKITIWNEHWHSLGLRYANLKRLFFRVFVDEFIAVSEFLARTLPANASVHTIKNGVWSYVPQPTSQQVSDRRASLEIPARSIVVLMVAAFKAQKRHLLALRVCEKVVQACPGVVFIFLGDGPERERFLMRASERRISQHIRAPGYVHNVEDYYSISDISILTSHNEGFGYVVLESMKHALPVVVFDTGAPAEVVRNADTGFVVADGDIDEFSRAVLLLISDKSLRREVGERARRSVCKEYNRDSWIRNVNLTLSAIVNGRRRLIENVGVMNRCGVNANKGSD